MIEKTIHYIWFGKKPMNDLFKMCVQTFYKQCPDFKIICWNENNYSFDNCPNFVKDAYKDGKMAFVSDYVRYDVLHKFGGLYLDSDVELIKPLDKFLENEVFFACETDGADKENPNREIYVNPGLIIGGHQNEPLFKEILEKYESIDYLKEKENLENIKAGVILTNILKKHGLKNISSVQKFENITIYTSEYFCPLSRNGKQHEITNNTYSIHRFVSSWKC